MSRGLGDVYKRQVNAYSTVTSTSSIFSVRIFFIFSNKIYNTANKTAIVSICKATGTSPTYDKVLIFFFAVTAIHTASIRQTKHHAIINLMTQCFKLKFFLKFFMVFIIFYTVAYLPRYSLDITDKLSKKHQCRPGICLFCRTLCKTEIRTVRIK